MTASNNSANSRQSSVSKNPYRRLDHLSDLQEGVDKFDMVPRCLTRAYLSGKFPESKFRLLLCMLSHGNYFWVKRAYLEGIFCHKTLTKYLSELESEGYLTVEVLTAKRGGVMKVYHVRPITDWKVYCQSVDPGVNPEGVNPEGVNPGLKDTDLKDSDLDRKQSDSLIAQAPLADLTEAEKPKKEAKPKKPKPELDPTIPRVGNPEMRERVTAMIRHAKSQGLVIKADSLARSVDLIIEKLRAPIALIEEVWPIAVLGMIEKGNARPGAAFFNWMKFEMQNRQEKTVRKGFSKQKPFKTKRDMANEEAMEKIKREIEEERKYVYDNWKKEDIEGKNDF